MVKDTGLILLLTLALSACTTAVVRRAPDTKSASLDRQTSASFCDRLFRCFPEDSAAAFESVERCQSDWGPDKCDATQAAACVTAHEETTCGPTALPECAGCLVLK